MNEKHLNVIQSEAKDLVDILYAIEILPPFGRLNDKRGRYYGKISDPTTYCGADGLYGLLHRRTGDVLHVACLVAAGHRYSANYGAGVG